MKRLVVVCVLGYIGCGGGGGETAVQKCDDFLNDLCDRGVECIPQQTGTHDNCVQMLQQLVACGTAKQVSTTYNRCIQQIKGDSCPILFPNDPTTGQPGLDLPADCTGAIEQFAPGDATPAVAGSPFHGASRLVTVSAR